MMCLTDINPAEITEDNIPSVLGAIVVELKALNVKVDQRMQGIEDKVEGRLNGIDQRLDSIDKTLADHEKLLWGPLRMSKDTLWPLIWKNKLILILIWFLISVWISAIDWVVRGTQWTYFSPLKLP